jgi:hypothetical protein
MSKYTLSIEPSGNCWWLCQRGIYDSSSVLEGQPFRQLVKPYNTLEKAKADNPGVKVDEYGSKPEVHIPTNPPSWFDPANAGERWNDDY